MWLLILQFMLIIFVAIVFTPREYWTTIGIGAAITGTAADNENNFRFASCRGVPSSKGRAPAIGEVNIAKVSKLQ